MSRQNLLILSDLHLGEQGPTDSRSQVEGRAAFQTSQMVGFLRHYGMRRYQDRPWKLVIAGDFLDFMYLYVPKKTPEGSVQWHVPSHTLEGTLQKLQQILALHRPLFAEIGRFVLAGHDIVLITGNHDAELNWPEVQEAFLQGCLSILQAEGIELSEEQLRTSIAFCPWFYYEPGLVYVEHGHLYDRLCTVEDFFAPPPEAPAREMRSPTHYATQFQHQCRDLFRGVSSHQIDQWGGLQILRWMWTLSFRHQVLVIGQMLRFVCKAIGVAWERSRQPPNSDVPRALEELAQRLDQPIERIRTLQGFAAPAIYDRFFDLLQFLYLDRLLLIASSVFLFTTILFWPASVELRAALLTVGALGFLVSYRALSRRCPVTLTAPGLLAAAFQVAGHLACPLIVFGHNHRFERLQISPSQIYINLGTWSPSLHTSEPSFLPSSPSGEWPQIQPYLLLLRRGPNAHLSYACWQGPSSPPLSPPFPAPSPAPSLSPSPALSASRVVAESLEAASLLDAEPALLAKALLPDPTSLVFSEGFPVSPFSSHEDPHV